MTSIADDQERRILEGVYALTAARVQGRLPIGKRGLRAKDPIEDRIPAAVNAALESVVQKIFGEVDKLMESERPFDESESPLSHDGLDVGVEP